MEFSNGTTSIAATTASNGTASSQAAPHRKNAAQRNRSDSPYQGRTAQKDNPTQLIIKQAVDFLIQQVEAGKSETLAAYLTAMARFHNYSFGNIVAIARQRPTATRVAGFGTWKEMGRFVKRGEKGIQILAPMIGYRDLRQSRLPGPSPEEAAAADERRCRDEGRAGKAAPRGSAGPGHRVARTESHRRGGSCAADEARPAICCVAADGDAGRAAAWPSSSGSTASANRRTAPPRRNCWQRFCPRPRRASWAAFWWRRPSSCPCTTRPTRRRFSAMPRTPTRWTLTPSPRQSNRSSRRRRRGRPQEGHAEIGSRSPRRKQRRNHQPTRSL